MAYELSFTPEFFVGPHDLDGSIDFDNLEAPTSVYQAVKAMSDEDWWSMADEVFDGRPPELITVEMVMDKIRETNTCRDLRSPVEVYIDEEGYHSVLVHEREAG
jgi:hypothetical protein